MELFLVFIHYPFNIANSACSNIFSFIHGINSLKLFSLSLLRSGLKFIISTDVKKKNLFASLIFFLLFSSLQFHLFLFLFLVFLFIISFLCLFGCILLIIFLVFFFFKLKLNNLRPFKFSNMSVSCYRFPLDPLLYVT